MVDLVAALRELLDHSEDEQGDPLVICQTTECGQPAGPLLETGDTAVNTILEVAVWQSLLARGER